MLEGSWCYYVLVLPIAKDRQTKGSRLRLGQCQSNHAFEDIEELRQARFRSVPRRARITRIYCASPRCPSCPRREMRHLAGAVLSRGSSERYHIVQSQLVEC